MRFRPTTTARAARAASATALCLLATVAAAAPASAAEGSGAASSSARLRGSGGATLTKDFRGMEGDAVHFEIDARTDLNNAPGHARGHFHVTHHRPDGALVADFEGDLTCLAVGGRTAIATGVITSGTVPWFPDVPFLGSKVSLTVQDEGRNDRLGWLWGAFGTPVSDCQGTVPFLRTDTSSFTVRG
ncbi:hypothetical protein ABT093_07045 [Kitasatospora sp. NPDC002551]|uniref:hypothetical protein n=1 Tax=unclassified Kitasatospora TaxID=2633591 RepID=UPI0033166460